MEDLDLVSSLVEQTIAVLIRVIVHDIAVREDVQKHYETHLLVIVDAPQAINQVGLISF